MLSSQHPRSSQVRAALVWGRAQAGAVEATALAERAAALAMTSSALPGDLAWARQLAARAAAAHIAYAALAAVIAAIEQRTPHRDIRRERAPNVDLAPPWRSRAVEEVDEREA